MHTHYANLKVAEDAPDEVIRAAYKTLSQKYHPDRNPGDKNAERIMVLLNTSYELLSNPIKRREHDRWIASQQSSRASSAASAPSPPQYSYPKNRGWSARPVISHIARFWLLYGIAIMVIWSTVFEKAKLPPPGPKPYQEAPPALQASQAPAPVTCVNVGNASPIYRCTSVDGGRSYSRHVPAGAVLDTDTSTAASSLPQSASSKAAAPYEKPARAPNGRPWPRLAGYVSGFPRLHTEGLSSVTVDNGQNNSDVFVKLVSIDNDRAYPVRQFYIPAFAKFKVIKIAAGHYDVRYRDLDSGALSRSDAFDLTQNATEEGTQFSNTTLTLYKVKDGNMETFPLAEAEF